MKKILISLLVVLVFILSSCSVNVPDAQINEVRMPSIVSETLFNNNGVVIRAKELNDGVGEMPPSIELLIENNNPFDVTIQCYESVVNGFMCNSVCFGTICSNKKLITNMYLDDLDDIFDDNSCIKDIKFSVDIFKSDDFSFINSAYCELVTDSNCEFYYNENGYELVNVNNIKIIVQELQKCDDGYDLKFYIRNDSDIDIAITFIEVSVDGCMVESSSYDAIYSGKCVVCNLHILQEQLDLYNIIVPTQMELSVHIFDNNSWEVLDAVDNISFSIG